MKAQIPDNEKRLKDKILAHRVPFEEQAWDAMDALLDGDTGKKAPAEPPAPQETPTRSFKNRRFFILLFLFSAVAVFSAKLGMNLLENAKAPAFSKTPSNKFKKNLEGDPMSAVTTAETTTTVSENSIDNTSPSSSATENGQKTNNQELLNGKTNANAGKRTTNPDRGWAVGRAKPATDFKGGKSTATQANAPAGSSGLTAVPLQNNPASELNTGKLVADSMQTEQLSPIDNLAFLPLLPPDSLNAARDLPEAPTVPVKNKTRRNLQRGWVYGANLGITDYQPFRLSLMPVIGYHVNIPVQKGFLETGLLVTAVTGYNQKTDFEYSAPGGSLQIYMDLDNLLFLEVPLVYKRALTSDKRQSWLAGIRTSVVVPVNNYVSNSGSTNGNIYPNAIIDLNDGVRWFDLGLTVGWQWRFSERWAMDVRYTQGLMDLTHDNFFNNTETTLNSDLQLTFRHYVSPYKKNN